MDKVGINLCPEGWIEFIEVCRHRSHINNPDE